MGREILRQLFIISLLIHWTLAQNAGVKPPSDQVTKPRADSAGKPAAGMARKPPAKPAPPKKIWQTLNGAEPVVIAHGGYSGLLPDSGDMAYNFAGPVSLPSLVVFCDLQITKDNEAFCLSSLALQNSTTVNDLYPDKQSTYNVNGQEVKGWFSLDYKITDLFKENGLLCKQGVTSRPASWDGVSEPMDPNALSELSPKGFWLNVQYDLFYFQHKLSPAKFILSPDRGGWIPTYISSPEISFLKSLVGQVDKKTKLIFSFLDKEAVEPTTRQKYGAILGNLATIKAFASGILVPKDYIWPVDKKGYLLPATTLVDDAHKEGLEVHVSGFANDFPLSYNYSWDPTAEYLQFIDNSQFSVDGLLTDFPSSASGSIACLAQNKNASKVSKALIISHNGASGDYPGCTDLAYQRAMENGADVIDCSVQMTKDGVAFCLNSTDLSAVSTAPASFMEKSTTIPELQAKNGIFTFDLTWAEVQSLKPQIENPFIASMMYRNPANKNAGKFVTLSQFLDLAKTKPGVGVLINVENAAYLASKQGLDIVDAVVTALGNASLDKEPDQRVMIQSDDSSVLLEFKDVSTYQRVLNIKNLYSGAPPGTVAKVKDFADAVTVQRYSVVTVDPLFIESVNNITRDFHAANVSVYVMYLQNEFMNFKFDYLSDPYMELNHYIFTNQVDGIFTDFPASASAYLKSPCADPNADLPFMFPQVEAGGMLKMIDVEARPPPSRPPPPLDEKDVVRPPLPPVADKPRSPPPAATPSSSPPPAESPNESSSSRTVAGAGLSIATMGLLFLLSIL